ncbi:NSs [Resistencia virus]|nr:NSs [Resistencia virus]QLA47092.1 NSs [Barranqueras virus]QLA47102.1 NSs [Antequera virus]
MEYTVRNKNTPLCRSLSLNLKTSEGKETTLTLSLEMPTNSLSITMENFLTSLQLPISTQTPKVLNLNSVRQTPEKLYCVFEIGELRLSTTITQDWAKLKFYQQNLLCIEFQVSLQNTFLQLPMEMTRRVS